MLQNCLTLRQPGRKAPSKGGANVKPHPTGECHLTPGPDPGPRGSDAGHSPRADAPVTPKVGFRLDAPRCQGADTVLHGSPAKVQSTGGSKGNAVRADPEREV
jgi:hypothetical protein